MLRTPLTHSTALLLCLISTPAQAYELRRGPDARVLVWAAHQVAVEIDSRPLAEAPGAVDAIRAAFARWSSAGAPVKVTLRATPNVGSGQQDGSNTVRFVRERWEHGDSVVGLTLATYYVSSGLVFETDIVFDATTRRWSTAAVTPGDHFDVQAVVTHEVGHFFGLGHSADPDATMYAATLPGEQKKRSLAADDRDGLAAVISEMNSRLGVGTPQPPAKQDDIRREVAPPVSLREAPLGCEVAPSAGAPGGLLGVLLALGLALLSRSRAARRYFARPAHRTRLVPLITLLYAILAPDSAEATLTFALTFDGLVARSTVVLEGTVTRKRVQRRGRLIFTDYALRSTRCWKGRCERRWLRALGGELGGVGLYVPGAMHLRVGDKVLVFARETKGGELRAIGLAQGAFRLEGRWASRDLRGLVLLNHAGQRSRGTRHRLRLSTLRAALRAKLRRAPLRTLPPAR